MKREDFVSDQMWERYVEERNWNRKLYQKQGFVLGNHCAIHRCRNRKIVL